ncbi:MAG: hypothetical protein AAFN79_17780 [Pseudomonadota bacterium]
MVRLSAFAFLGAAVLAAPTDARQPISVSLAECSAIYGEMSGFTSAGSTPERKAKAAALSVAFRDEAVAEATREKVADPQAHVGDWLARHEAKWSAQIRDVTRLSETKDWIDYCKALGRDRGVAGTN